MFAEMIWRVSIIASIAFLVLLVGCVNVSKSVLLDRSAHPVGIDGVDVLLATDEVPETCERVALMYASATEFGSDRGEMVDRLREEAGKLGANTLLLQRVEDPGDGEYVASAITGSLTTPTHDADAVALWCPDQ